jgi:hypothetical protein
MTKKITTLAVFAITIGFASCVKDRTCECTTTITDPVGTITTSAPQTTTLKKIKRSDAKSLCETRTETNITNSGATTIQTDNCKLK